MIDVTDCFACDNEICEQTKECCSRDYRYRIYFGCRIDIDKGDIDPSLAHLMSLTLEKRVCAEDGRSIPSLCGRSAFSIRGQTLIIQCLSKDQGQVQAQAITSLMHCGSSVAYKPQRASDVAYGCMLTQKAILRLRYCQSRVVGRIMFSTCPFVRSSVRPLPNLSTRYFKNE